MQIVVLLLLLALLGYILLRLKEGQRPGSSKAPRQSSRSDQRLAMRLEAIDDPRLAATAMMAAMANHAGPMNHQQQAAIIEQATENFDMDSIAAGKLLTHARSIVADVTDLERCFAALLPTIQRACTPEEIDDLLDMLAEVASHCPNSSAADIGRALVTLRNKVS